MRKFMSLWFKLMFSSWEQMHWNKSMDYLQVAPFVWTISMRKWVAECVETKYKGIRNLHIPSWLLISTDVVLYIKIRIEFEANSSSYLEGFDFGNSKKMIKVYLGKISEKMFFLVAANFPITTWLGWTAFWARNHRKPCLQCMSWNVQLSWNKYEILINFKEQRKVLIY